MVSFGVKNFSGARYYSFPLFLRPVLSRVSVLVMNFQKLCFFLELSTQKYLVIGFCNDFPFLLGLGFFPKFFCCSYGFIIEFILHCLTFLRQFSKRYFRSASGKGVSILTHKPLFTWQVSFCSSIRYRVFLQFCKARLTIPILQVFNLLHRCSFFESPLWSFPRQWRWDRGLDGLCLRCSRSYSMASCCCSVKKFSQGFYGS